MVTAANPTPKRAYDVSRGQIRYVRLPLEGILIKMLIAIPTFIYLGYFIKVQVQNYSTVPSKEYQLNLTCVLFVPDRADYTGAGR